MYGLYSNVAMVCPHVILEGLARAFGLLGGRGERSEASGGDGSDMTSPDAEREAAASSKQHSSRGSSKLCSSLPLTIFHQAHRSVNTHLRRNDCRIIFSRKRPHNATSNTHNSHHHVFPDRENASSHGHGRSQGFHGPQRSSRRCLQHLHGRKKNPRRLGQGCREEGRPHCQ